MGPGYTTAATTGFYPPACNTRQQQLDKEQFHFKNDYNGYLIWMVGIFTPINSLNMNWQTREKYLEKDIGMTYPLTSPELYNIIYLKPTWLRRIFPRQLCRSKCSPPAWSVLTSWSCPICICRQISPITTHRHVRDIWRCCAILREGAFWHTPNF